MSVFKRYKGNRITSKHPKYAAARWWVYKRVSGHKTIHQAIPEARTREQAELAERRLVDRLFGIKYGVADTETTFGTFCETKYKPYYEQNNVNIGAKRLYVELLNKHWQTKPITAITPQDCRNVQDALRRRDNARRSDSTLSDSSVNRVMSTASKIFTLACQEGVIDRNPMQFVKKLAEPPRRRRLLTDDQKAKLWFELGKDDFLRRLVTLAIATPLRKGQLLALKDTDISFENRIVWVIASKGRDARPVPLNQTALGVLRELCAERSGTLFPVKDFRRRWSSCLVRAKINKKKEDGPTREDNYHFHDLRTEFASALIRNNINPKWVQDLFAHSDAGITDGYINTGNDLLFQAVDSLDATILQPTQEIEGPPN